MSVDLIMLLVLVGIVIISITIIFGIRKIVYLFMKSSNSYSCNAEVISKKEVLSQSGANPRAITSYSNNYYISFKIGNDIRSFQVDYLVYEEMIINQNYHIKVEANDVVEYLIIS